MADATGFIQVPLGDTHEAVLLPEGEFEFICGQPRETTNPETNKSAVVVPLIVQDPPEGTTAEDYEEISHFINLPHNSDDERTKRFKLRLMKRFFILFNIPFEGNGFNPSDIPGSSARCLVTRRTDKNNIPRNQISLPEFE